MRAKGQVNLTLEDLDRFCFNSIIGLVPHFDMLDTELARRWQAGVLGRPELQARTPGFVLQLDYLLS
jgi:hypothetical protein